MEIESLSATPPDEEQKTFTNYNGNYEENLEKYLNLFLKKEDDSKSDVPKSKPPVPKNPFPFNSLYLRKRKFEYYFVLKRSFKKIKGIFHCLHSRSRGKEKILACPKMNKYSWSENSVFFFSILDNFKRIMTAHFARKKEGFSEKTHHFNVCL